MNTASGAQPAGAADPGSAARAVEQMFDTIAPRYDLLNHVLSLNIDRLWWWRTARRFRAVLARPEAQVVDLCCGTGDMTLALLRRRPRHGRPVLAIDFAHQMLLRGAAKFNAPRWADPTSGLPRAIAIQADVLHLPLRDDSVDLLTTAFGFRNLASYDAGLREFHRVLAPGGELGILDFSEPPGLLGRLYAIYFRRILPRIGRMLSGVAGPYAYLPASVHRFPPPEEMLRVMRGIGFRDAAWTPYTFGIAGLYKATKVEALARPGRPSVG